MQQIAKKLSPRVSRNKRGAASLAAGTQGRGLNTIEAAINAGPKSVAATLIHGRNCSSTTALRYFRPAYRGWLSHYTVHDVVPKVKRYRNVGNRRDTEHHEGLPLGAEGCVSIGAS